MKLLHICCNLAGSSVFPQLFEALRDEGLEQEVFVPEKRESSVGQNVVDGVATHYALTVRKSDAVFFFRKAQRSVPAVMEKVDMGGISLVHAHTLFTDGSIARALSRRTGVPYTITVRYSDEVIWRYEPHLRPMARRVLRDAQRVVFLSAAVRDKVLASWVREGGRDAIAAKCEVIPNGIRAQWLDGMPRHALRAPVRVGFAGLLNGRKRPLDALAAVHAADDAGSGGRRYVLLACGSGPQEEQLKAGLRGGDRFEGRVQGMEAMKRFYAECDMLLVPSSAETFGMVYLEAMSQGVPVLYTRGQGFDGQFPEGEAGYSVACGDIQEQAARIADLCEGYAACSARCIALAKEYAWPLVAKKWMTLYACVVKA